MAAAKLTHPALAALDDLAVLTLEQGGPAAAAALFRPEDAGPSGGRQGTGKGHKPKAQVTFPQEIDQEDRLRREADRWIGVMEVHWQRTGRWVYDGTRRKDGSKGGFLKVTPQYRRPVYSLETVRRIFPHLALWDQVALLIHLDGEISEADMDAKENIRAALRDLMELELMRFFGDLRRSVQKEAQAMGLGAPGGGMALPGPDAPAEEPPADTMPRKGIKLGKRPRCVACAKVKKKQKDGTWACLAHPNTPPIADAATAAPGATP